MPDKKFTEKELIEMSIEWFKDVSEKCDRLTSGNVSHNSKNIKGFAIRCQDFLLKNMQTKKVQYCPKCGSKNIRMFDSDNDKCSDCNFWDAAGSFPLTDG